jgi:hypothetical protein
LNSNARLGKRLAPITTSVILKTALGIEIFLNTYALNKKTNGRIKMNVLVPVKKIATNRISS